MIEKITPEQLVANGVVSAPDKLTGNPEENKKVFDRLVAELVAPKLNEVIDVENEVLTNEEGRAEAENERAEAEGGRETAEEGRAEAENARDTAERAREEAEKARQDENSGTVAQVKNAAKTAESWAVGGTGTRPGEDEDNAKYWAGQAKKTAGADMSAAVYDPEGGARQVAFKDDKRFTPVFVEAVMLASGWVDNAYSFEETYPHAGYNIEVGVANTATVEQFEAFGAAMICGSADSNIATALGDVPTVDIPIIIKAVAK